MRFALVFSCLLRRLEPPASASPAIRDDNIQGLRAWAALSVVIGHLVQTIPHYAAWQSTFVAGRSGVLLFFAISGYVIGLVNRHPWDHRVQAAYWRSRLLRLVPLYWLALVFAALVAWWMADSIHVRQLVANALFLQNFDSVWGLSLEPITVNKSVWTLNYEMVYYAVFILVWRWRPTLGLTAILCLLVSAAGLIAPQGWGFIAGYASGFAFWLAGLGLAWMGEPASAIYPPGRFPFIGLFVLLIATQHADPGKVLLAAWHCDIAHLPYVSLADLMSLPACILLLGGASGRLRQCTVGWRVACILPPALTIIAAISTGHSMLDSRWFAAALATLIGSLLIWVDVSSTWLSRLTWWGGISYAFYLFHQPVIHAMSYAFPERTLLCAVLAFALTTAVSWLLEKKFQPLLMRRIAPASQT